MAAPMHVDAPAMQERYSGIKSIGGSGVADADAIVVVIVAVIVLAI